MADNVAVTAGVGTNIKTDQGGSTGAHMQVVKLAYSSDGDETFIGADANGLDVDVTRSALPTGAATEATLAAIKAKTDNIPAAPAQDRTTAAAPVAVRPSNGAAFIDPALEHATAASPSSARLSDGAAFYDAVKTGQLPAALVGDSVKVTLRASGGTEVGSAGAPLRTDPTGSTTQPVSGTVTANQGTAAAAANAWKVKVCDGTNTMGLSTVSGEYAAKADIVQSVTLKTNPDPTARTPVTKSVSFTASQEAQTIWDPTGGTKFVIDVLIVTVTTSGPLTIFDGTDTAANQIYNGTPPVGVFTIPFLHSGRASATADNILKYTTGAAAVGSIQAHGFEVA